MPPRTDEPLRLRHFIGGEWVGAPTAFERESPVDGRVVAAVPCADGELVSRAVHGARRAFEGGPWRRGRASERAAALLRLADAIEAHAEELAQLATFEMGKPITLSRDDEAAVAADR